MSTGERAAGGLEALQREWLERSREWHGHNADKEQTYKWHADALAPHIAAQAKMRELVAEIETHCPCGHRPESPKTHAHVTGCPVARLVAVLEGKEAE